VDWETYNVDEARDRKILDVVVAYGDAFPLKDADGNQLVGGALALPGENVQSAWGRERAPSSGPTLSSSLRSEPVSSMGWLGSKPGQKDQSTKRPKKIKIY